VPEPAWLPQLMRLQDSGHDWEVFIAILYLMFTRDFIESSPSFEGERLELKREPLKEDEDKEATFWHLISEGDDEANRTLDEARCERIRWPRPVIEHCPCTEIHRWESERRGETRIVLAFDDYSYVVVLARRSGYLLPWTAYPVEREHRRRKLKKEHQQFVEQNLGRPRV
jgi:hypothetical protein